MNDGEGASIVIAKGVPKDQIYSSSYFTKKSKGKFFLKKFEIYDNIIKSCQKKFNFDAIFRLDRWGSALISAVNLYLNKTLVFIIMCIVLI